MSLRTFPCPTGVGTDPSSLSSRRSVIASMARIKMVPDFLAAIQSASRMHFTDGALTRAQHEMIASYVSAINRCRY
jgi:hypothetical protein